MKLFFKMLRIVIGPFILLWEKLSTPKGITRPLAVQHGIDQQCRELTLYQFSTCPFCVRVRKEMRRLSLDIALRDARNDPRHRQDLLAGGGEIKVPCLRIADTQGNVEWMYESGDIIRYLQQRFA